MRTKLRSKVTLLFMMCAVLIAIPGATALAQDTGTLTSPTIQSDKADYAPGELVTLTGSGWQPGESVNIVVNDDEGQTWNRNVNVTADASGNISDQFNLPNTFVATYSVNATGASGAVATTRFTDASLTVLRGPTGNPPNVTFTVNWQKFTNNNCTTPVTSGGNLSGSQLINTDTPGSLGGFGNNGPFVRLTVPPLASPASYTFDNWDDAPGSDNQITPSSNTSICVRNPSGPQNDIYRATYKQSDTTPPVITHTLNPANPDGANQWYKSNVSLTWSVTDPESAVTKNGCVDQNITSDQQATNYSCSATSAGGSSGPVTVSIKRDATPPTNIQFVGGPAANGSYAFGNVPAEPTCTATDATSTMDTCVVAGYSNAVGNQTLIATATDKASNQATQTRAYTVTKANQTINFGTLDNKTFGDADFNVSATGGGSGNPVTFAATGDCTVSGNTVHITGAGSCTITASQAGNDNYNAAAPVPQTFPIDKANATIDVQGYTGTYDGQAHGATGTAQGVGGADLSNLLDLGAKFTDVPGGTAHWTFSGNTNYNDASGNVEIKIDKADTTTTVTCGAGPFTYNGLPHTPCQAKVTGPGGLNDDTLTVQYDNNVNAGTATASASYAGNDNYNGSNDSKTFEIDKADATIDVQGYTGTFDGNAHGATGSAKGVNNEDLSSLLDLGAKFTDVPGGTAHWTFSGNTNYNDASGNVEIKIDKAPSATEVTCTGGPFTYDGSPHTPCTASVTGAGGLNESLNVTYQDNTNAGQAKASASFDGDANHNGSSDSKTFTIQKASSTTEVTCPASVTYDGSAKTPCTAKATGAGGLNENLTVHYTNNTNAGTASASASFDGDANHTGSQDSKTFTIQKAATTTTVTCPASVTYNGLPHTPCSAKVTGPGGLDETLQVSYQDNVNAGTAKASASYAETANYLGSQDSKTFTIQKANQMITFAALSDKIVGAADFNVSATANSGLPVSFAASPNATCTISGNTVHIAGVGTCTITASQAGNDNYNAAPNVSQTFKVTYNFGGFLQPINYTAHQVLDSNVSTFKTGSTVPVKFLLKDANGNVVQSASAPQWTVPQKGSATSQPVDEAVFTDQATSGTLYKWDGTQYHYNWSTKGVTAGFYYKIGVKLDDGQIYYTYISLR